MTPADELRTAAFQLRNPLHLPGLKVAIDPDVAHPLADWLDFEVDLITCLPGAELRGRTERVLAVVRAINGNQP